MVACVAFLVLPRLTLVSGVQCHTKLTCALGVVEADEACRKLETPEASVDEGGFLTACGAVVLVASRSAARSFRAQLFCFALALRVLRE